MQAMLVKPQMVMPGADGPKAIATDIAKATLDVMSRCLIAFRANASCKSSVHRVWANTTAQVRTCQCAWDHVLERRTERGGSDGESEFDKYICRAPPMGIVILFRSGASGVLVALAVDQCPLKSAAICADVLKSLDSGRGRRPVC